MELTEMNLTDEQLANVQKYVQSHEDRIRTDYSKRLKDANDELAKYKPVEKSDAEKALEARIAELEARENEIKAQERQAELQNKLKEKGLDVQLLKFLNVGEDADTFLDEFANVFNAQLLDGSYKPSGHKGASSNITKEQFKNMGYLERVALQENNPSLYAQLIQE